MNNQKEELLQILSPELAMHYRVIPISRSEECLSLATDIIDENDRNKKQLSVLLNTPVELAIKDKSTIDELLLKYYRVDEKISNVIQDNGNILLRIIREAVKLGSSDIHIEPSINEARIRYRIDGKLIRRFKLDTQRYFSLINQIKINCQLDIAEKRLPQDGRMQSDTNSGKIDLRVSTLPTLRGEKVVLRILDNDSSKYTLENIGMNESEIELYKSKLRLQNGLILLSGPTGSGKTTTLYSTLDYLNDGKNNIVTIEDPVEFTFAGINQVQVHEKIGYSFGKALRSFLRQDPDIIMIGEIRDLETAQLALRAALTGHLVFSTLHTNSAIGTISRLVDMQLPPFLLRNALRLSIAQRLVRRLCDHCKIKEDLTVNDFPFLNEMSCDSIYSAVGCEKCYYTGYSGRIPVFELLEPQAHHFGNSHYSDNQLPEGQKGKLDELAVKALKLLINGLSSKEEIYPLIVPAI